MRSPIDLSDDDSTGRLLEEFRLAGFACLRAPEIAPKLGPLYQHWHEFFSSATKCEHKPDGADLDGYFDVGSERALGSDAPDPKEFFHFYLNGQQPAAVAEDTLAVFRLLQDLATQCLDLLENALPTARPHSGVLPLNDMIADPSRLVLRITSYCDTGSFLAAPHHDINLVTLFPAATRGGLEIRSPSRRWIRADRDEAVVTVLPGDMLEIATAGFYEASLHRVVRTQQTSKPRLSLSFFVNPADDVVISPGRTAGRVLVDRLRRVGYNAAEGELI